MPVNASYEFINAEKIYLRAATIEEKITALEGMIRSAPKHKSSENLLAELKTRLKKLKEKKEKSKKIGKTTRKTIRKEGFQCVLIGFTKSGKSSLLSKITNACPLISEHPFTTQTPEVGTLEYRGVRAQIVDLPSIGSEKLDMGVANTADLIILVITKLEEIEKISPYLVKTTGKRIIIVNKIDLLSEEEIRKLQEKIRSKKLPAILISCFSNRGIEQLKEKIFQNMGVVRVYMKEPGKSISQIPLVLSQNSTVKDAAESILKGFSQRIKATRVTGPSSKFPNQKVGLGHILKDKDIVEFHTS